MLKRACLEAKIRVLMVDDHILVREGLKFILAQDSELEVTAEAGSVPEALDLIKNHHFDVILLDLSLPGQSGMTLLQMVKAKTPSSSVLVVSACNEDYWAMHVFKAGADGFINKEHVGVQLIPAVWQVISGKKYFDFAPKNALI